MNPNKPPGIVAALPGIAISVIAASIVWKLFGAFIAVGAFVGFWGFVFYAYYRSKNGSGSI